MNYLIYLSFLLLIPFAIISINYDIKYRKIPNKINFLFVFLNLLIFAFFITQLSLINFIILIVAIVLSLVCYSQKLWGGADGKIFIGLSLLLLSFKDNTIFFNFLINLALMYTFVMTFLVVFKTTLKSKIKVLKEINYGLYIFQLLMIFLIIKRILNHIMFENIFFLIVLFLCMYFLISVSTSYIEKLYLKINKINSNITFIINLILFAFLVIWSSPNIMIYFIVILSLKIFTEFISNMTVFLKQDKAKLQQITSKYSNKYETKQNDTYQSPFSIYLFVSAILTLLLVNNIVTMIILFFQTLF